MKYILHLDDLWDIIMIESCLLKGGYMGTENDKNYENIVLDALACEKITRFLAPKRRHDVFDALSVRGETSQGDLAKIVESTATALSNQLYKFEKFEYKLLEVQNVGKFRYYKLSKYGKAYLKAINQTADSEVENELNGESVYLQEARRSIHGFMELYADRWKALFNKVLMRLVNGRGIFLDEQGEMLVKQYLRCVELLSWEGNHDDINSVLKLVSDDILRDDIEQFMKYFEPFIAVLNVLKQNKNIYEIYMLVQAAFYEKEDKEEKTIEKIAQVIGWNSGEYNKLKDRAHNLKECVSEYSEGDIYQYFTYLLPNQEQLCMYIARCICGAR